MILILSLLLVTPLVSGSCEEDGFAFQHNYPFAGPPGEDGYAAYVWGAASSYEECLSSCTNDVNCNGFSWNSVNFCWYYNLAEYSTLDFNENAWLDTNLQSYQRCPPPVPAPPGSTVCTF